MLSRSTGRSHAEDTLPLACFLVLTRLTAQYLIQFNVIYAAVHTEDGSARLL